MARINIEDSLINDERFTFVCSKIGRYEAMGQFVFLAKLAQRYWLNGDLIPEDIYNLGEFSSAFLTAGLIEKNGNEFYLKGSEEHFAWITSKKYNGKKGGRPRINNNLRKATESYEKANESYGNPLSLSLFPSLTQLNTIHSGSEVSTATPSDDLLGDAKADDTKKITFSELLEIWNHAASQVNIKSCPSGTKLAQAIEKNAKPAFKEYPTVEDWERIVEAVPYQNFRTGNNDRHWRASLEWLFQKSPTKKIKNYILLMSEWDERNNAK